MFRSHLQRKKRSRRNEKILFWNRYRRNNRKCGLFNVDGEVLDKWEIKTRTENNGENIIADIAETMNAKIAEKGLDKEEIVGAGVGVPGPAEKKATFR